MLIKQFSILLLCLALVSAAPKPTKKAEAELERLEELNKDKNVEEGVEQIPEEDDMDTGLMYDQYLKKVLKILESDSGLRKKMEDSSVDDIKSGKLSKEVNFLPWELREKLNDVKKEEMHRLRKMIQAKNVVDKGGKVRKNSYLHQIANHLDHKNPHSFEANDLTNLIKSATKDLEQYDDEREVEFKDMEMDKQLKREEKLKKLDQNERKRAEDEYLEQQRENVKKHKTNHPGSRAQLEEVWKDEDGLEDQKFEPKTFFRMHDQNGDGYMDPTELEALFTKDLDRAYDGMKDNNQKSIRIEEERRRMRKHVMGEVDKDGDSLVSLDEFLKYSGTKEFDKPVENYKSIDDLLLEHALYTATELDKYRDEIHRQEEEIRVKLDALKKEAKSLGGLRRDLTDNKREAMKDGKTEDHEKINLDDKEVKMKEQEAKVQALHKQLQNQSKEVVDMKRKLKTHEASERIIENIMDKLEQAPVDGKEKDTAVEKAHKDLDNVKKAQAAAENKDVAELGKMAEGVVQSIQSEESKEDPKAAAEAAVEWHDGQKQL